MAQVSREPVALLCFEESLGPGVIAHTYNPSIREEMQVEFYQFKAILVYIVSSRTARTT